MATSRRRATFGAGLLALSGLLGPARARGASIGPYGPESGTELAPGVREVQLDEREIELGAYRRIVLVDLIFQPGAGIVVDPVPADAVYLGRSGLLRIELDERGSFVLKSDRLLGASRGAVGRLSNPGAEPAVLRVVELLLW